ncbi:hypothetical protein Tco_0146506 [Tanacetum coccineum]
MISMRMKKFYKKTGRKLQFDAKEPVGFDKTKVECYNCYNRRRDAWNSGTKDGSRTGQNEDSKALVIIDGEGVDWTNHSEDEELCLMALQQLRTQNTKTENNISDASIEIKAYSQGLKKVEAQLVAHQQGQLWFEQKIKFMKIDLDDKTDIVDVPNSNQAMTETRRPAIAEFQDFNGAYPVCLFGGKGPTWLFDLDYLTDSMNYHPVRSENQANIHAGQQEANHHAGTEDIIDAGDSEKEDESAQDCFEANEEAEALRKQYAQENENLVIQAGAAKLVQPVLMRTISFSRSNKSWNRIDSEIPH